MNNSEIIWLASYPRSGNTFLRTILWHCFGLRSASVYPNDLGNNKDLENYTGHIEHGPEMQAQLQEKGVPLLKTHEAAKDSNPAIYVIRDGRAACVSLWKFYNKELPLNSVIEGNHRFGTWESHVQSWDPWTRPNTLLLQYEALRDNLPASLETISEFIKKDVINETVPSRDTIAGSDGRWVKAKSNWKSDLSGKDLQRFMKINKSMLKKSGYV